MFKYSQRCFFESFVTSVFWDTNSSSGRGNDLCVEDAPRVLFLPLPSILIWPNMLIFVKNSMCSVKVILVCVCIFTLYQIKSALVLSSVSMLKPLSFPQKSSAWYQTYGSGNQSHLTTAGAGAEQGGVCHSCAPADAFSSPSFPVAGSPKEDSQIQRSAFQCLIMEGTIGEREKILMTGGVNLREQGKRIAFEL